MQLRQKLLERGGFYAELYNSSDEWRLATLMEAPSPDIKTPASSQTTTHLPGFRNLSRRF